MVVLVGIAALVFLSQIAPQTLTAGNFLVATVAAMAGAYVARLVDACAVRRIRSSIRWRQRLGESNWWHRWSMMETFDG